MAGETETGIVLSGTDVSTVMGMVRRGDRRHDIAAWFGVPQGRVKEVAEGQHGTAEILPDLKLPPKGPPGPKGKHLRKAVDDVLAKLSAGDAATAAAALKQAADIYDADEMKRQS